jgi:hypothetical protein
MTETLTKEQIALKEAEDNLQKFLTLQTQKAAIDSSMKGYKAMLKTFADSNPDLVDKDGNLKFAAGYLHFGKKTVVKFPKKFSIASFIKKFPALIKWEFRTGPVKAFFEVEKEKAKLKKFSLRLIEEDTFEIIAAKAEVKAEEPKPETKF